MDEKRTVNEEIEESLRICEELLNDNPDFIPERPDFDLEDILEKEPEVKTEPVSVEKEVPEKQQEVKVEPVPVKKEIPEKGQEVKVKPVPVRKEVPEKGQPEEIPEEQKTGKRRKSRTLISVLVCVVIAVVASILITKFVANHTTVEGSSMEPCLKNGDELIVEKLSYLSGEPERFDVIVFEYSEDVNYIKRIIGLPGESVRIEEGKIYINDRPVFDVHGKGEMTDAGIAEETVELGSDEYFVLGDNREASKDSRDKDVGLIKADKIIGKAWLRVMPFDTFGIIE